MYTCTNSRRCMLQCTNSKKKYFFQSIPLPPFKLVCVKNMKNKRICSTHRRINRHDTVTEYIESEYMHYA